jgi:N,N-dimethylformamidase
VFQSGWPLIGYVSDERYVAIPDVLVEFRRGEETVAVARSTARGAVFADLAPGEHRATLAKAGFGSKHAEITVGGPPHQFRLLSDGILGYVWPKWSRSGERGEFRVHSTEPYHLSLWRYGSKKELVRSLGWFDEHGPRATMQITPDGDYCGTGVEWNRRGYTSPHHTQFATAPERSGLYYFHAETESGNGFFAFPWVVAPDRPRAGVAVLASTNNWNAYNSFGGRSNYINATGLPEAPTVNARQDLRRYQGGAFNEWGAPDADYAPLSFERPEPLNHIPKGTEVSDPIRGRQPCHTAPAEWRLLGWMEREGFDYDLYSEFQLHTGELDLDAYRVLVLSTHPEYWSREMYSRVKEWVFQRGGRLMYLGGNGLNCEVELTTDPPTMRCRSQLQSASGAMVVNGCESRFHRTFESEANLLGVVCTDAGIMTAAPYQVRDSRHWAFHGTGLREGDTFGERSLHERIPGGASGHETDKRSPSSPANTQLLAKGLNPEEGGAEIVYHEPGNGGAVFSVGSITWPASVLVDDHVSRITRNVLERFLG